MKKILFAAFAFAALFASACSKTEKQDPETSAIHVRFRNKMPDVLKNAQMYFDDAHVTPVGHIGPSQTTNYIAFDYFEIGTYDPAAVLGFPMGALKGEVDGQPAQAWSGAWCGTGMTFKQLEPGFYTLEIEKFGDEFILLKFEE